MTAMLELSQVRAGWGETTVLEQISLGLGAGEAVSLIGRNGVGKTTLLETIMGHTRLEGGQVRFDGADIAQAAPHRRARRGLGYVPQEREIFPSLSVEENLALMARPGRWSMARVFGLFPRLQERRRSGGHQLSGGEQQMLAIARALLLNPTLLLLDEPSEGLAPVVVDELFRVLMALRGEGMAILLVEQRTALALSFAPRCVIMDRGRIVHDGPSAELRRDRARLQSLVGVGR